MKWTEIKSETPPDDGLYFVSDGHSVWVSRWNDKYQVWEDKEYVETGITHWGKIEFPNPPLQ